MDLFTTSNILSTQIQGYSDYNLVNDDPTQPSNVSFKDNINLYLKLGNSLPKFYNGSSNLDVVPKSRMDSLSGSVSESTSDSSSPTPFVVFDSDNLNSDFIEDCDCSKGNQDQGHDPHNHFSHAGRDFSGYPLLQLAINCNHQQAVQSSAYQYLASNNFEEGLMDPMNTPAFVSDSHMDGYMDNVSHNSIGEYSHFIENVILPDSNSDIANAPNAAGEMSVHDAEGNTVHSNSNSSTQLSITNAIKLATNAINNPFARKFESITEKLLNRFPKSSLGKRLSNNSALKCFHCNILFYNNLDLSTHIDQNKLIRAHKCPIYNCPFNLIGFEKKAILRHHLISQHFRKGYLHSDFQQHGSEIYSLIYKCEDGNCGKCFYRKDSLSRHIKLVHNNKSSKFNKKIEKEKISRGKRRSFV